MEDLKKKIIDNQFINKIRLEFCFDDQAYLELKESLLQLKSYWNSEDCLDKGLVSYLYVIPAIIRGQSSRPEYSKEIKDKLTKAEIEIDNLILEALS
jgi:hypothetical protein